MCFHFVYVLLKFTKEVLDIGGLKSMLCTHVILDFEKGAHVGLFCYKFMSPTSSN